jgi:tyrosyl-tRNA synthetase
MFKTSDPTTLPEVLTRGVAEVLPSPEGLAELMAKKKIRLYLGIDPTGSLLTLGHSIVLRKIQQFADLGHEVILLIGNGTVKIGDPTGKDSTRPMLTNEVIEENFKTWRDQASKILNFDQIEIRRNGDWLDKLNYSDMIKLMAKTTVQQLLERDMFQERLKNGQPIHAHEIIYPLLQGYDSVVMDVDLEVGGTDQTFNMMMGRTLQKSYNDREKWVLTTPIINGTDGRKMSKSYGNYVALTDQPNDMYGKLMSISDDQIVPYFTLVTDLPLDEIGQIEQALDAGDNPMEYKKRLAHTVTQMYHDQAAANQAAEHFQQTVQDKQLPTEMPEVKLTGETTNLIELLKACLPEDSATNLRRLIDQGAVELLPGENKPTDPFAEVDLTQVEVVRVGKRRYFRVTS